MSVEAPERPPEVKPQPAPPGPPPDYDEVVHLRCCEPDRAMCGYDLSGMIAVARDEIRVVCIVCEDFEKNGCPRCGE